MGSDKIRYLIFWRGRWHWRATMAMRKHGFRMVNLSKGGPGLDAQGNPRASDEDRMKAVAMNAEWDAVRFNLPVQRPSGTIAKYPAGSVGDGYRRAMTLRQAARVASGMVWTSEQAKRDDWPRAWRWLEPEFADCDPRTIEPEHFLSVDPVTGEVGGLVARIEREVSVTERHRTIKVWRSLWRRMASMKYCSAEGDPSRAFENKAPDPRQAVWQRAEVLRLVQVAWRSGYRGLAACMAVAWDSMLSPVDARSLTPEQCVSNGIGGIMFELDRAKTGRAAAATLTQWSQAILLAYLDGFGAEFSLSSPIFRTRGRPAEPGKGGKPWLPRPYTKNSLVSDFAVIRELAFGPAERRQLADMRRSGAVEGDAGGGSVTDQSNKMANTVSANSRLRKTYNPVNIGSVKRFDVARAIGAKSLETAAQNQAEKGVTLSTILANFREVKRATGH
jgi:hypothetical protein